MFIIEQFVSEEWHSIQQNLNLPTYKGVAIQEVPYKPAFLSIEDARQVLRYYENLDPTRKYRISIIEVKE
jgi:hypothetical protein